MHDSKISIHAKNGRLTRLIQDFLLACSLNQVGQSFDLGFCFSMRNNMHCWAMNARLPTYSQHLWLCFHCSFSVNTPHTRRSQSWPVQLWHVKTWHTCQPTHRSISPPLRGLNFCGAAGSLLLIITLQGSERSAADSRFLQLLTSVQLGCSLAPLDLLPTLPAAQSPVRFRTPKVQEAPNTQAKDSLNGRHSWLSAPDCPAWRALKMAASHSSLSPPAARGHGVLESSVVL